MTSTSETGHAKNVNNFDELISFATGYDLAYNPSKASIKLSALQSLSTDAKNALKAINTSQSAYSNAVADREAAFIPLNKVVTRVLNALKASGTTDQVADNAKTIVRKIEGTRATPKKTDAEKTALEAEGKKIIEISASQMSYDSRLANLDKLIQLLASVTLYIPNEIELKVATLTILHAGLNAKNAAVIGTTAALSNARILRNDILYKADTGLVDVATGTKTYIKSLYGATGPQYKQVSKLMFRAVKA